MKKTLILVFAVLLLTGCSIRRPLENTVQERYIPVETAAVSRLTLVQTASYSGRALAEQTVMVMPPFVGKVEGVRVRVGEVVRAGDILFTMETKDIARQVEQARLSLTAAQANLRLAEVQRGLAASGLERNRELAEERMRLSVDNLARSQALFEVGAISPLQLEQALLMHREEMAMLQSQLEQAEIAAGEGSIALAEVNVRQAELAFRQAQDMAANARVAAPITGVVTAINVIEKDFVSTAQPAAVIMNLDYVRVQIDVPQSVINTLAPGQSVMVTVSAASSEAMPGEIYTVSPAPSTQSGLYPVVVRLGNDGTLIKPGMFAAVSVEVLRREDVLAIESRAVIDRGDVMVVYVPEGDRARRQVVTTGVVSGNLVEIVDGLSEGDQIIVRGQQFVQDGSLIQIVGKR